MQHQLDTLSGDRMLILFLVVINTVILKTGFTEDPSWYRAFFVTIPLLVIAVINLLQKEAS